MKSTPKPPTKALSVDEAYAAYLKQKASNSPLEAHEELLYSALKTYAESICKIKLETLDEDVVQNSLVELWKGIETFKGTAKFSVWAYSVIFRNCQDALRQNGAQTRETQEETPIESISDKLFDPQQEETEKKETIESNISKLDAGKQDVVRLRLQHLTYEEISERLHISEGAAKMRWERALEEIRTWQKP